MSALLHQLDDLQRSASRIFNKGKLGKPQVCGLDDEFHEILGLKVPLIRMPVAPGRSLAILVEVAARNQLLRTRGLNAAKELVSRLEQRLREDDHDPDADTDDIEHGGHV